MSDQQPRSGKFVCASCLEDKSLQQFAHEHGSVHICDYCGTTPRTLSVVRVDEVTDFMGNAIAEEWCDPAQTSPVDGGAYSLKTIDIVELFERIDFEVSNQELMKDLLDAFADNDWCEANWSILSLSQRWGSAWERFERVIKHERRYTFWHCEEYEESAAHPDHLPPSQMLGELQAVINIARMVKALPVGTLIWRVRVHEGGELLRDAGDFTPPPLQYATQPNRMSPAGVPMFYGAADFETAFEEVVDRSDGGNGKVVSGGQFANVLPLNVLDLTILPEMPSYFGPEGPFNRHVMRFLRKFTKALAQPLKKDRQPHIEYVPTLVFTEFVRHVMKGPEGVSIDGLKYPSSKNERDCFVVFADREDCLPATGSRIRPQVLKFVDGSIKTVPAR